MSFRYHRPTSWQQAMELLSQRSAVPKMGGCDLLTKYRRRELDAKLVVALNALPGIAAIEHSPVATRIGAAVTLNQLASDFEFKKRWPVIARVVGTIASPAIRNVASVVGNITQRWDVSDLVPLFAVCDAQLLVRSSSEDRSVSLAEFAENRDGTSLQQGEIVASLEIPVPEGNFQIGYERFAFREAFDLPLVAVAVGARVQDQILMNVRVAVTGAGPLLVRCGPVEAILEGSGNDESIIENAAATISNWADPKSDFQASAEYRRYILKISLEKALAALHGQQR